MPLVLDYFNKIIALTAPTTEVNAQVLHDFVENEMASPVGLLSDGLNTSFYGDVLKPEGKIEDENNPGVFSQIILVLNPEWQIQFWQGSGYSRIFGGKIVGGVGGRPMKATGAADDITVLESPVDGLTIASGSGLSAAQDAKLSEAHTRLGLESGNAWTDTPAQSGDASGGIVINNSGDGESTSTAARE